MVVAAAVAPLVAVLLHGTSVAKGEARTGGVLAGELWFAVGILVAGVCLAAPGVGVASLSSLGVLHPGGAVAGVLLEVHRGLAAGSRALIGPIVATAVVCISALLAAFGAGVGLLDDTVWSTPMAAAALAALALGTAGLCAATQVAAYLAGAEERSPLLAPLLLSRAWEDASFVSKAAGLLLGAAAGAAGGLVLVPCVLAGPELALATLPSLGAGALAAVVAAAVAEAAWTRVQPLRAAPGPEVLAGALWCAANGAALVAIRGLGYARTYPLFHCHMAVVRAAQAAGKELEGRALDVLAGSWLCLFAGAAVLFANTHQG